MNLSFRLFDLLYFHCGVDSQRRVPSPSSFCRRAVPIILWDYDFLRLFFLVFHNDGVVYPSDSLSSNHSAHNTSMYIGFEIPHIYSLDLLEPAGIIRPSIQSLSPDQTIKGRFI